MDKKLIATLGTIAVGGLLLGTSAYAAIAQPSGYDLYKEALKKTTAVQNLTPSLEMLVKNNGNDIFKVNSVTKLDKETKVSSSEITVTVGDKEKNVDIYKGKGKIVVKSDDSEIYKVLESNKEGFHKDRKYHGEGHKEDMESIVDALMTNYEKFISTKDLSDGNKAISLQLSEGQISPVINAVTSVVVKNMLEHGDKVETVKGGFHDGLKPELPELVTNIKVNQIDLKAQVSGDNLIQEQTLVFALVGQDINGKTHELVVEMDTNFENFNTTTPETIDLTGKEVQQINHKFKHPR